MEAKLFCQSCTMPIDNLDDRGTERGGSRSSEYCKYCYQSGVFTQPDMTLKQMKNIIATRMNKMKLPENIIKLSLNSLPKLKRWQKVKVKKN